MDPNTIPAIGIDFGGTSIKMGVVVGDQIIATAPAIATQEYSTPEEMAHAISEFANALLKAHPEVQVMGMGLPGFVDFYKGTIHTLTNVPGWNEVPIRELLQKECNIPLIIENDANCMAYAEWKLGAGNGYKHLICLTLGTGVGSGLIVNGGLLRGAHCSAGELGQTSIDYKGRIGHYGNRGALEDYIGNKEIAADARTLYGLNGQDKAIVDCSPLALEKAALAGDPIAQRVWEDMAQKLACALINCCYILNPEAIVIGGAVAKAADLIFEPLHKFMKAQLYGRLYDELQILPAKLGTHAGIIGAARLAIDTRIMGENQPPCS